MTLMLLTAALGQAPGTVAGLSPELRDAVLRDAACTPAGEPASDKAEQASVLETAVATQDIRGAAGGNMGVIVKFSDSCHCHGANCGTYVFLRSGAYYKLAFSGDFTSLHPVRVFKRGYPSLSAKVHLSDVQTESTVYDWNGKAYAPGLCATITQAAGRRVPSIVHHDCSNAP